MSWSEDWQIITQRMQAATSASTTARESANLVIDTLQEGVEISVAHRIISEHWGDTGTASRLRTKLFGKFPKENGEVLLYAPLTEDDLERWKGDRTEVMEYFGLVHAYVIEHVAALTAKMNRYDSSDMAALELYNGFRKNVLRYICYIDYEFYSVRQILEEDGVLDWDNLAKLLPIAEIENGDYLFMDDFIPKLVETQGTYLERDIQVEARDQYSVNDMEWVLRKMVPHIRIPFLFGEYLNTLLSAENV